MSGGARPGRSRGGRRRWLRGTAEPPPVPLPVGKDLRSRARDADRFVVPMERRRRRGRPDPIELDVRHWWDWFTHRPAG
jgi:hypothetical protein